jgi:hypothetical protein
VILNVERKETNKSHDIWSGYEPPCVWRWIKVEKPSQANMTRLLELRRCQTYMTLFEYAAGKSCIQIPSIKFML